MMNCECPTVSVFVVVVVVVEFDCSCSDRGEVVGIEIVLRIQGEADLLCEFVVDVCDVIGTSCVPHEVLSA